MNSESVSTNKYRLVVKKIECKNLKNVQKRCFNFLDKNEVFVTLDWSGSKFKTVVKHKAGSGAVYEENEIIIVSSNNKYKPEDKLNVQVWDSNRFHKHMLIAWAEVDIFKSLSESPYEVNVKESILTFPGSEKSCVKKFICCCCASKESTNGNVEPTDSGNVTLHLLFEEQTRGKF